MPQWIYVVIALVSATGPVAVQPRLFLGGELIADVKRFSETGVSMSVGVSLEAGRSTSTSSSIPIGVVATQMGVSLSSFRSQVTNRITATSVLLGYHFPVHTRVHVGARGGLAFLQVSRDYTTIRPAPLAVAPVAALVIRPFTQRDDVAAATVGGEVALDLTQQFAFVADVRAHTFSSGNGGPGGFAIRPGLGGRWTF